MNGFTKGGSHLKKNIRNKRLLWSVSILLIVFLCIGGCALYLSDSYRADAEAISTFAEKNNVPTAVLSDRMTAFGNSSADTGLIFYPGGKVECAAYEPLMRLLASQGLLCVLIEMPFNLAVLDADAAEDVQERFPETKRWFIGGHSLGGAMAASYLSAHVNDFVGLVLLGSYSTADLSQSALSVLSLVGSEDGVMNREAYEQCRSNLPTDLTEITIEGGCHAYFGMYGLQKGDGTPLISADEQIRQTARYIADFTAKGEN